ncbi:MAG: hypothetical protein BWY71_01449 [Planctomycetes bacterium ADurb.Bin412]|nr:MAG: hypothetical protein BWY71_01449 [Planctomycetes bacterium ADurb.Bin412]
MPPLAAGQIEALGIFGHHACGGKLGNEITHGVFHHVRPMPRQTVRSTIIKTGNDFLFQQIIQGMGFDFVFIDFILVAFSLTDGPAGSGGISLAPPAVQNAQVNPAVGQDFHAAGTGGFHPAPGSIQPYVHALHQIPGYIDIVIFQEYHSPAERFFPDIMHDLPDKFLAFRVLGMGLARKYKLDGTLFVGNDFFEPFHIMKQQRASLVGGESPGKADGQGLRIQNLLRHSDFRRTGAATNQLRFQAFSGKRNQPFAPALVGTP